jgi:hypothetical protein
MAYCPMASHRRPVLLSSLLLGALTADGLQLNHGMSTSTSRRHSRAPAPCASLCDTEAWPQLQAELDMLPVFLLANGKGDPLQHKGPKGEPMIIFFSDLFRAEAELANAKRMYPDLGLELLPVGLGDAFQRVQEEKAMIVPSQNELMSAGLDPDGAPNTIPLFGCTKLMQPRRSNPELKAMPLFISSGDARAAVDAALNASGFVIPPGMEAQGVGLDIMAITLQKACELIVSGQETRFEFFAPTKSVEWVEDYAKRASRSDGQGEAGGDASAQANANDGGSSEDAEKQAMFETLIDQRQEMLKRTGGVIPRQQRAPERGEESGADAAEDST